MAHFAQLDKDNKVINVIVIDNDVTHDSDNVEQESLGIAFCKSLYGEDTVWLQTSYSNSLRGKFAGIGDTYFPQENRFAEPCGFPSWNLSKTDWLWHPPVPRPTDDKKYTWSEEEQNWIEITA